MADLEVVELLTQAKERIMEHGWGVGSYGARSHRGLCENYCLEEALCGRGKWVKLSHNPVVQRSADYIQQVTRSPFELWMWNDVQPSAGVVLTALDDAILLAKEASFPES